ncbi:hypothetical protein OROMI_002771 [Orobanche minor]
MSTGGTQNSLRKTLGALKDTTTVSLAKINSDYKELDIAIVKATNHHERPAKERHIRAVFTAVSATRPRADVAYCIHALARRLSKTQNWAVALKTLIVIHRALREVDTTFQEEIINYGRSRSHLLNLAHFKDDSSPNAWDYSAWVRAYALFLEERLECFRVLKYDIQADRVRTKDLNTPELLEQLPALQQLLYRVLGCQPQGAAPRNFIIQLALSMVALESVRIYNVVSDGAVNLVDKFFEMQKHDAVKALDIYQKAGLQAERLSEFYEICKTLDVGRGERYIKIEQPPASFIQAMEEYVREAPRPSTARKDLALLDSGSTDNFIDADTARKLGLQIGVDNSKAILAIEHRKSLEVKEERPLAPPPPEPEPEPEPEPVKVEAPASEPPPDLLGLHEPSSAASALDEKNAAVALAIVPVGNGQQPGPTVPNVANGTTSWELALVTAQSSTEAASAASKLAGGLDKLTLDSLYDDAIRRTNQNTSYNPWKQIRMSNSIMPQIAPERHLYASNTAVGTYVNHQQHAFLPHQQMMMVGPQQQPINPFGNSYGAGTSQPYGPGMPIQAYNPYTGLI